MRATSSMLPSGASAPIATGVPRRREVSMATRILPCSKLFTAALLAFMATSVVVVGADPPSLDPHQESTFANIQLVAPLYSTLIQIDPYNFPKIIGDAATE